MLPLVVPLLSGRTLVWFDTQRIFAPQRWLVDEALQEFRLPLWNPYAALGSPFLADAIHGVLHPISVAVALLGTARSVDLLALGHVLSAGLGAWLLARDLGASRAGAAVAAFAFGMSGFVLSMVGLLNLLAGAGSLPLCLAGLRRFGVAPSAGNLTLGAVGTAVLAYSGDIQMLVLAGVMALVLAGEGAGWRGAVRAAFAGSVGLLVAGAQLVPSALHLPRTDRGAASFRNDPRIWSFEPWRAVELVFPGLLWGPDPLMDEVYRKLTGPSHWPAGGTAMPLSASVFLGLVPVTLAAIGLREGRRGRTLGGLALVLLWAALGPALGADAVLGRIPLWKAFRYSEKLVGPLTLVLALLAGLGLGAVVERRVRARSVGAVGAGVGVAAIGCCLLLMSGLPGELHGEAQHRLVRGGVQVLGALGGLGVALVVLRRLGARWGSGALATVVWLGMAAASPAALRPGDPSTRLGSPGPALDAEAPGARVLNPYNYEPLYTEAGLDWIDQCGREHSEKAYAAHNVRLRLDSFSFYGAMRPGRLATMGDTFGVRWPLVARRFGATHVIIDVPRSEAHWGLRDLATGGGTLVRSVAGRHEVWAVPHGPWAGFPAALRVVEGEEDAFSATVSAISERSPVTVVEGWGRFDVAPGRVLGVERGLESVRIEAEAEGDSTLVVNDAWWPGWEATVDGRPAVIFRADALVRAVRFPAGRHVLEMRYRPPEVRWGVRVSLLGLACLVAGIIVLRRRAAWVSE
jgi:hypothetical protein